MTTIESNSPDVKLRQRYRKLAKLLLLFSLIYVLAIVVIIVGTYFLGWGNKPAGLTIEQWVLSCIVLISVFIIIDILALIHYLLARKKRMKSEQPTPAYTKGKQITIYTIPVGAKGGIFSKTFVQIDTDNVLNLRCQIIPPNDLWEKKC